MEILNLEWFERYKLLGMVYQKLHLPVPRDPQLLHNVPLLVRHPAQVQPLLHSVMCLLTEAHRIPPRHDVVGDDAAEGVGHDGHFASPLLELGVAGAE